MESTNERPALVRIGSELEAELGRVTELAEEKRLELKELDVQARRIAGALRSLRPEPQRAKPGAKQQAKHSKVGPERMAEIEKLVRIIIRERGEVRQADVRAQSSFSSAVLTAAFRQLKDANVIRLARVERSSGSKYFKLTREAERARA